VCVCGFLTLHEMLHRQTIYRH